MSLPTEKYRSLVQAKDFFLDLCDPKKTPRVPKVIRERARWALRHYPWESDLETLAQKCPTILEIPCESRRNK